MLAIASTIFAAEASKDKDWTGFFHVHVDDSVIAHGRRSRHRSAWWSVW